MQRFHGKLGGRQGTLVLQEEGNRREPQDQGDTWFVVPGSGTGDLSGLRGEGALKATLEEGRTQRWIIGSNAKYDQGRWSH